MNIIERMDHFIKWLVRGWNITFAIFLLGVSIPGYIHLINILNQIPLAQHSAAKLIRFVVGIIFIVFIFALVFVKILLNNITYKKIALIFLMSVFGVIGSIGLYAATDLFESLNRFLVMFIITLSFIGGMKVSETIIKYDRIG